MSDTTELDSDVFIRGMIENLDAYRKPDRSMSHHLLIMDLQELRVIVRREKRKLVSDEPSEEKEPK